MKVNGNIPIGSEGFVSVTVEGDGPLIDSVTQIDAPNPELPWLMPGFIDQHSHGGGGGAFESGEAQAVERAIEFHASQGTTSLMASLVSASKEDLLEQVATLAPYVHSGSLMGIHLEGPWISLEKKGAHDSEVLRGLEAEELAGLLKAAQGAITKVTVAPEIPGVLESIPQMRDAGIRVAIGHTQADYQLTLQALDAGATIATHLFNAMSELLHRSPGPAGAFFERSNSFFELIADFEHLHPAVIRAAIAAVGPERAVLVSDSICAVGGPLSIYDLGTLRVQVSESKAVIADTETLARSLLTMHSALVNVVRANIVNLDEGAALTASSPAAAMGLTGQGRIRLGFRSDLVALNHDLSINAIYAQGVDRGHS